MLLIDFGCGKTAMKMHGTGLADRHALSCHGFGVHPVGYFGLPAMMVWIVMFMLLASPARAVTPSQAPPNTDRQIAKQISLPGNLTTPCLQAEHNQLSCDAIQARNSDKQIVIAWVQAVGLIASLVFSGAAAWAAVRAAHHAATGAHASVEALAETKRMNAAAVRPHVNVEEAWISFDQRPSRPVVALIVRNASQYTAYGWEWQGHLRIRLPGNGGERTSILTPWMPRGVRGVDIPPPDPQRMMPHDFGFELTLDEMAAISELHLHEGLTVFLTVFSRAFDIFGNEVFDEQHFVCTAYNVFGDNGGNYQLQRAPFGTQVQGQEIRVPPAPVG